jgi:iron complex transport system substrate-binding protein
MFDYSGDPEYIIAASPDLVLIRPFIRRHSPGYIRELERAGIPIVSLYTDNFDNFDDYIRRLASLAGLDAGPKLAAFHAELNAIRAKTAAIKAEDRQRIFFESTETEIRTAANGSFPALAIGFAGGVNIAGGAEPVSRGSSIAAFGMERVLEHADDIDVYAAQSGAMRQGGAAIPDRPGYSVIKAVRNGRVFVINEKLISSPTFRFLTGVKELARYMYPDLMDDFSELDRDAPATRASFAEIAVKALRLPVYVPSSSSYYRMPLRSHVYGLFADLPWTDSRFDAVETAVHAGLLTGETVNGREYIYPAAPFTGTGPERVPGGPDALDRPLTNGEIISAFAGNR